MEQIQMFNKQTGIITTHNKYLTKRTRKLHYFRKYRGYGISTQILTSLKRKGITEIILLELTEDENQEEVINKYTTTTNTFYEKGKRYTFKEADTQLILPLRYWQKQ